MILPLALPTTSPLPYPIHLSSPSHPSLPLTAQTHHSILRSALKTYSHAPRTQKPSHLSSILQALNNYLPYLFALSNSLDGKSVNGEELDIVLKQEVESEWKSVFAATELLKLPTKFAGPRATKGRVKCKGIDADIVFVMTTLAIVYRLQAREQLHAIYASGKAFPQPEARLKSVSGAMKALLEANGIHIYSSKLCADMSLVAGEGERGVKPPEMDPGVQDALAALAMAEATLLAVLKDDPYPAAVSQARDKNDREWMVKAPEIPKVRAHLFARLCIAAGEHAGRAEVLFSSSSSSSTRGGGMKLDDDIIEYTQDLRKTARAKACRFFGVDEELGGETGKAIAWLRGAKKQLGMSVGGEEEGGKGWGKGWGKVKRGFEEKREDKRIEKGGEWGADAGRIEEGRVVEMLERKWVKVNDTINTQLIPSSEPLLASMPSGREIHSSTAYVPPELEAEVLEKMRAPPDPDDARAMMNEDDSSEDDNPSEAGLPGAFPARPTGGPAANEYY